ncbi:hypothetical protein DFH09DRAFT_1318784 [Mycena vulgaris]|nr:hypothetical protein DFH09DRAFT_1318784 [Mycena vulgaris]
MTKTLPGRGAKGAPEFDGKALNLTQYWEDIEEVAESLERTEEDDKIRLALRYVSRETEVLWKGIMTAQTTTWVVFKALVAELYPGSDGTKMFTLKDLDNLISEQVLIRIKTKEDFSEYHRHFKTITVHLLANTKLTALEEKREYPKGLEERFRNRVYQHLQIVSPNHPSDDPYTIDDFVNAAKYILDGPSLVDDGTKDSAFIKKEIVDLSDAFEKMNTRFKVEMQSLHRVVGNGPSFGGNPQYSPNNNQYQGQSSYPMYQATALENAPPSNQYPRDQGNGYRPSYPGRESWSANPGGMPAIPPTMFTPGDVPTKAALPPAFKYQSLMEDPALLQAVISRTMDAQITISNKELCVISAEVRRYHRENTITKRIPTVETSMIAVEGEPAHEALVLIWEGQENMKDHILTASPIDSLRVLDILVNNSHTIACTLDQGSEIIAMNRTIWQELGVSLSPDKVLTMESAGSNQSQTAGVVENLKFSIGDIDIQLQVHVVDGAPFDILMGRPFFRFTECLTKDRADGTQELTLTCPNTGRIISIPTRRKPPRPDSQAETSQFQAVEEEQLGFV